MSIVKIRLAFGMVFATAGDYAERAGGSMQTGWRSRASRTDVIKDRNSLNGIIALAARASLCAMVGAGAALLAAGPASASYEGTIAIDWGNATSIAAVEQAFDTALQAKGLDVDVLIPYAPSQTLSKSSGATVDSTYNADNNVVGTVSSNGTVTSYTLSNYSGGTFLQNISEPTTGQTATSGFTIEFVNPTTGAPTSLDLNDISFDYEIFPNINCTALSGSNCGTYNSKTGYSNLPSLNVTESYYTTATQTTSAMVFQRWGIVPGTTLGGTQGAVNNPDNPVINLGKPATSCNGISSTTQKDCGGVDGTAVTTTSTATYSSGTPGSGQASDVTADSPASVSTAPGGKAPITKTAHTTGSGRNRTTTYTYSVGSGYHDTAPQLLGTSGNVSLTVGKGVSSLTFNDWPATIAISQISFTVPEPNSWSLIVPGLALFGFVLSRRRKPTAWDNSRRA
jgi:hypothetical protein